MIIPVVARLSHAERSRQVPPHADGNADWEAVDGAESGSDWMSQNGRISLQETDQQGYIGDFTSDRVTYFGYPSPVNRSCDHRSDSTDPLAALNNCLGTIYQRSNLLQVDYTDVGLGSSMLNNFSSSRPPPHSPTH